MAGDRERIRGRSCSNSNISIISRDQQKWRRSSIVRNHKYWSIGSNCSLECFDGKLSPGRSSGKAKFRAAIVPIEVGVILAEVSGRVHKENRSCCAAGNSSPDRHSSSSPIVSRTDHSSSGISGQCSSVAEAGTVELREPNTSAVNQKPACKG